MGTGYGDKDRWPLYEKVREAAYQVLESRPKRSHYLNIRRCSMGLMDMSDQEICEVAKPILSDTICGV